MFKKISEFMPYIYLGIGCVLLWNFLFSEVENKYSYKKPKESCSKVLYYFQNEYGDYIKADRQQFRILFTGQVVNAYFYVNNREYSTKNYYKETKVGVYKYGECIVN